MQIDERQKGLKTAQDYFTEELVYLKWLEAQGAVPNPQALGIAIRTLEWAHGAIEGLIDRQAGSLVPIRSVIEAVGHFWNESEGP